MAKTTVLAACEMLLDALDGPRRQVSGAARWHELGVPFRELHSSHHGLLRVGEELVDPVKHFGGERAIRRSVPLDANRRRTRDGRPVANTRCGRRTRDQAAPC